MKTPLDKGYLDKNIIDAYHIIFSVKYNTVLLNEEFYPDSHWNCCRYTGEIWDLRAMYGFFAEAYLGPSLGTFVWVFKSTKRVRYSQESLRQEAPLW